ncbi:MAG: hypothetical protein COA86_12000 [Kangiella sp.]|nr:MAG: hypothetical protein COA86_12000 [Kangiella sp.]
MKDVKKQSSQVDAFIAQLVAKNSIARVSTLVCLEIEYLLRKIYQLDKNTIIEIFDALLLKQYLEFDDSVNRAIELYAEINTNFADILIGECEREHHCTVVTFDKKSYRKLDNFIALESGL